MNLGRNHPQTKRAQSELASLRNRLASETRHVHSSLGTSYQVGKQKEKELLEAMEIQKKRVLELNRQRDESAFSSGMSKPRSATSKGVSHVLPRPALRAFRCRPIFRR